LREGERDYHWRDIERGCVCEKEVERSGIVVVRGGRR